MRNDDKTGYEVSYFDEQMRRYIEVNVDKFRDKFMETDDLLKEEKLTKISRHTYYQCIDKNKIR